MPVRNAEIAEMFDQTAELLDIRSDNPFRSRAYHNAARVIERLPKSITSLLKVGEDLSELPGIGKDPAGKIETIVATDRFDVLDHLKRELPGILARSPLFPVLVRSASSCSMTNAVFVRWRTSDGR
jgi:DNA polymerase (family 10)